MELHPYGQAWAASDLDRLLSLLADDVIYHSPLLIEPAFEGRDSVAAIFAIALDIFEDDQYTHDLGDERSHLLVADSRVLDKPIKTTTLLEFDAEGKIREIWMMARPLTAITALAEGIGKRAAELLRDPAMHEQSKPLAGVAATFERTAARVVGDLNRSTTEGSSDG